MSVQIRSYRPEAGNTGDRQRVCEFLARINREKMTAPHYLWARWEWQFGPYMNREHQSHIGVAEEDGEIVGLALYESDIGEVYFCLDERYGSLKETLLVYAVENMQKEGKLKVLLRDGDLEFQQAAVQMGFQATVEREPVARIDCRNLEYSLPEGYSVMSFDGAGFDPQKYYDAIWRGFNNQRQRNEVELEDTKRRPGSQARHWNDALRVLIVAPNGEYAAHCGMWYLPGDEYAYVEPVFTLPEYRRMGLGKAAVLEGVKRCKDLGARCAYVGSDQQFYYSIGFYPYENETWWVWRKRI